MAELKCTAGTCAANAVCVIGGRSYCDSHRQNLSDRKAGWIWLVHLTGLVLWAITWTVIFAGVGLGWFSHTVLISSQDKWYFLAAAFLGSIPFVSNMILWVRPGGYANYQIEVTVIEFVERNASWFLIASAIALGGGSFFFRNFPEGIDETPYMTSFVIFISLSLLSLLPVVQVYWIPYEDDPKHLVWLRHLKTVPFAFGAGFFAAAAVALLLSVRALG